ncbi:MAG: hypothetical protein U5L05_03045 [Rubrivivax sp.]|nr:hypothetical protein [Rubrivivax sp.]
MKTGGVKELDACRRFAPGGRVDCRRRCRHPPSRESGRLLPKTWERETPCRGSRGPASASNLRVPQPRTTPRHRPPMKPNPLSHRHATTLVIGLLVTVATLATVAVALWPSGKRPVPTAVTPADPLAEAFDRLLRRPAQVAPGIVVRPFAVAGGPQDAALGDLLCDAMVTQIGRFPGLRVLPCATAQAAVAAQLDDARLARLLAVSHVLAGEVEALAGRRTRVHLTLREAAAGRDAWQWRQEVGPGGLQDLPLRVAAAAAEVFGQPQAAPPPPALNADNYDKALSASRLARRESVDSWREALTLANQVLAEQPDHVPTLYLRQGLRQRLASNADPNDRQTPEQMLAARQAVQADGLQLARRLAAADPADLRAQALLINHDFFQRRWLAAFERMDSIVARHPRHPGVMRLSARLHLHAGYVATARQQALLALQDNALDREAIEVLVIATGSVPGGDPMFIEALALAQAIGHPALGYASSFEAARRADWPAVQVAHAGWIGLGGKWSAGWVPTFVGGLSDTSQRAAAIGLLDGHDAGTRQHFAQYLFEYAMLGAHDRALDGVRELARLPPAAWTQHLWWPELAPVRQAAPFVDAMADLGLTALWEVRGAPDLCRRAADGRWRCD